MMGNQSEDPLLRAYSNTGLYDLSSLKILDSLKRDQDLKLQISF